MVLIGTFLVCIRIKYKKSATPERKTVLNQKPGLLILAALVSYCAGGLACRLARGLALAAAALFLCLLIGCLCKSLDSLIIHEFIPPIIRTISPFGQNTRDIITHSHIKANRKNLNVSSPGCIILNSNALM